jgi:transketolase C-terminal domain/subunit
MLAFPLVKMGHPKWALEDIAMFGAIPGTIIFQPADGISTAS